MSWPVSPALIIGAVIFWPALFFMIGGDREEELARLKGEYEALESAAIANECNIAPQLEAARIERERRAAEKAETRKAAGAYALPVT